MLKSMLGVSKAFHYASLLSIRSFKERPAFLVLLLPLFRPLSSAPPLFQGLRERHLLLPTICRLGGGLWGTLLPEHKPRLSATHCLLPASSCKLRSGLAGLWIAAASAAKKGADSSTQLDAIKPPTQTPDVATMATIEAPAPEAGGGRLMANATDCWRIASQL